MKNLDKDIELLERYHDGELNVAERKEVEKRIQEDPEFAGLNEKMERTIQAILHRSESDSRALLRRIHEEEVSTKTPTAKNKEGGSLIPLRRILSLAAALAVLFVAAWWLLFDQGLSNEEIFEAYYQPPGSGDVFRGEPTADRDSLLEVAGGLYNARNYDRAKASLREYLEKNPSDQNARLLLGITQLETEDYEAAIGTFTALSDQPGLSDQAIWYLALAYLRTNNLPATRQQLQRITQGEVLASSALKNRAAQLLQEIE